VEKAVTFQKHEKDAKEKVVAKKWNGCSDITSLAQFSCPGL